ncbi:MAG: LamG domain-containing protein [Bacteroidota bacterium]|nr:LamG domain-containing protein [Bacteroidota bacterium]
MKKNLVTLAILLLTCYIGVSQSISGVYNTDFKEMTITQNGNKVTGTYKHQNGRIDGTLNGHTLTGFWFQDNGKGKLVFEFNSDFSGYTGKWGYNDAAPASKWNGTRIAAASQQSIPVEIIPSATKTTFSKNAIENGLVSWYQFDGDFNDYSSNSYHATNVGASWTENRLGEANKALSFDGNSSGVRLDKGFPNVFNGSLTVSMWVYFKDDTRSVLFGSYNTANNVVFEKHTNNRLRIWWNNGQIDFFSPDNVVTTNKWFFVTFVRDKGQNKFIIYVNDKEVASTSGIGTDVTPAGPFYIGRDSRTGTTVTNGMIDDVKIYNRAITTPKTESVSAPNVFPDAPSAPSAKLSVNLNNTDAVAGNLNQHAIQLNVLKGTFDQEVKLEVKENSSVPQFDKNRATLIGAPFEITIDQKSKRLNKPVQVKVKLEQAEIAALNHPGDLWIGYFNGKGWDYFKPLEVNLNEKYVKFETYHFSDYAKAQLTKGEIINDFAYKNAVSQWVENDNNALTKQATEQMVSEILSKKMGLNNKSLAQDVVEAMMQENDYTTLLVNYNDGNMEDFSQNVAVLAGKKICDIVTSDSNAKGLLGMVTENSSKVGAAVKVAVALSEGDGEAAAKELSMEILNSFPLTKLLTTTARLTEMQINRWKNQELEAAYQAFVNGADSSRPWGFQVEKGNFEELWSQLRGLEPKIYGDVIDNYAALKGMKTSELNSVVLDKIRRDAKENMRLEFEKRKNQESKIETIKAENIKLISEFERANLLSRNRFGFTDATDFDFRIERLFRIKDMILKDTKSRLGFTGVDDGGIISAQTIAALTQIWYSDNGKEKYRQELIRLGYNKEDKKPVFAEAKIQQPVSGSNLDGVWVGTLTHSNLQDYWDQPRFEWIDGVTERPLLFIVYDAGETSKPEYRVLSLDVFSVSVGFLQVPTTKIISGFNNGSFSFREKIQGRDGDTDLNAFHVYKATKLKTPVSPATFPATVNISTLKSKSDNYIEEKGTKDDIDNEGTIQAMKDAAGVKIQEAKEFYNKTPVFQRAAEIWLKERKFKIDGTNSESNVNSDRLAFEKLYKDLLKTPANK